MAGISLPYGIGDIVWTKGGIGAAPVSRKVVSVYFIHGSTMVELEAPGQPVVKAAAPDIPLFTIFRGVLPFLAADIFGILLLIAFPQISLLLPNLMSR